MRAMFVVLLSAILGAFFTPAHSQTIYQPLNLLSWYCPLPVSIANTEFLVADAGVKAERCLVIPTSSNGYQLNGVAASARIDTNNNRYSKAVGGYFSAEVFGRHSGFAEAVGVYARVEPSAKDTWAVALHGECRARTLETGLCMGLEH